MRDLNNLIRPGSGLVLTNAININERGEILAKSFRVGTKPNDDEDLGHLVLLVPCGADDRDDWCSGVERRDELEDQAISINAVRHSDPDLPSSPMLGAKNLLKAWREKQRMQLPRAGDAAQ